MPFQPRKFGSAVSLFHKSDGKQLSGEYSCPKRFWYERTAATGTAAHETIARALSNPEFRERLLRYGDRVNEPALPRSVVKAVFLEEYDREVGRRRVEWYKDADADGDVLDERIDMVHALLTQLHKHVAEVVLVEPAFVAPLGGYWLGGHIDLLYRPRSAPRRLAITDWKTGAAKPHEIELDHSWEAGVYSAAVAQGWFLPRDMVTIGTEAATGHAVASIGEHTVVNASRMLAEREALELACMDIAQDVEAAGVHDAGDAPWRRYGERVYAPGEFPTAIHYVHLADYVPYRKAGTKAVKRREDLDYYGYAQPVAKHKYTAGQQRGPAWLPVAMTEHDLPRLTSRLRAIIGMVRMGRFIEQIGEQCSRCAFRTVCLTSGYVATSGAEHDALERTLRAIPGAADDAADLGTD